MIVAFLSYITISGENVDISIKEFDILKHIIRNKKGFYLEYFLEKISCFAEMPFTTIMLATDILSIRSVEFIIVA